MAERTGTRGLGGRGGLCVLNYALMDDGKIVKEIFIPLMFGIRSTLRHEKRFANIKFV